MYKIGVIGDKDSVLGFMAVGFSVRIADNVDEARRALDYFSDVNNEFAVVYITEQYASALADELNDLLDRPLPAVISIPSKEGSTGYGIAGIKKSVENAIGSDILFKDIKAE